MSKSPFILLEDAIHLKACNDIIASLNHSIPNYMNEKVALTIKFNKLEELRLQPLIDDLLDYAEPYYGFDTQSISTFMFEWYPEGYSHKPISSDSYTYFNGQWIKSREIDFTILIFLSNSVTSNLNDRDIQHVGGGLQFPTHGFTLHPKSGDVLMFPADNHFLNTVSDIDLGNMNMIRVLITAKNDYKYDRQKFPGTFKTWFN